MDWNRLAGERQIDIKKARKLTTVFPTQINWNMPEYLLSSVVVYSYYMGQPNIKFILDSFSKNIYKAGAIFFSTVLITLLVKCS
jgi:hypothetical protein